MGLVEKVRDIVEEVCNADSNSYVGGWAHTLSVTKLAKDQAQKKGADVEIVEIAALLHDYASILDRKYTPEHHIHGAVYAERILSGLSYPKEKIKRVQHCIYAHRGSQDIPRESVEAECVANGDAMSHFYEIPTLFHIAYIVKKMTVAEASEWVADKLENSWNKLTDDAKELVRDKYEASRILKESH